jgi:hypothetical protein
MMAIDRVSNLKPMVILLGDETVWFGDASSSHLIRVTQSGASETCEYQLTFMNPGGQYELVAVKGGVFYALLWRPGAGALDCSSMRGFTEMRKWFLKQPDGYVLETSQIAKICDNEIIKPIVVTPAPRVVAPVPILMM